MRLLRLFPAFALVAFGIGCSEAPGPEDGSTGAQLSVDYFGDTDVVGFHFELTRVSCDAFDTFEPTTISANVDLVDGIFPGMISLVEQTLDPDSRHLGSDFFVSLDPGCYDIMATPASWIDGDSWTASSDCGTASAEDVEVFAGQTTETTLISQCVGDDVGALDTLVLLNHPPTLAAEIDEKFNYECEAVNICATGYDVDDDPVEFVWTQISGPTIFTSNLGPLEVVGFEDGHRIWRQCIEIVTRWTDTYDYNVTVYDLGYLNGSLERIENLVDGDSHATLTFPIHTNWIEEPMCFDGNDDLVFADGVDIERYPGCSYTDAETFYCSGNYPVDPIVASYLCDGNDLIEENLYPECD